MGRGQYGVEAEKPVPWKNVAPYVRDEAEPVVRPATDANDGRVVAGSRFSGQSSIEPGGKGAQGGGAPMKRKAVAALDDVDELIEQYYRAQREFLRGNPEPVKDLFSHGEDVTLANPYGPPVRGWKQVAKAVEHAASLHSDGEFVEWQSVAKY